MRKIAAETKCSHISRHEEYYEKRDAGKEEKLSV